MHHIHIDRFAGISSPVHAIDPRAKLLAALALIILVVLTPEGYFFSFTVYGITIGIVLVLSRIPIGYILKRSLVIIPFALAISFFIPFITPGSVLWDFSVFGRTVQITSTGTERFVSLGLKAFLSFCTVITLVSSTRFGDLMWAAGELGFPSKLVMIMSFMYRYLFIIVDEASHMILARDLRSCTRTRNPLLLASGGIIGALWVRSYEHAEKLYYAMLLRGYTGQPMPLKTRHFMARDAVMTLVFVGSAVAGLLAGILTHV